MRSQIAIILICLIFESCNDQQINTKPITPGKKTTIQQQEAQRLLLPDTVISILVKEVSLKHSRPLTNKAAEKILYEYFRNKGVIPGSEVPAGSESDQNLLCVDYDIVYQIQSANLSGGIVSYWIGPPDLNGHCFQPIKAIILNTDRGFIITNEEFIPQGFVIDSINENTIYGYEYECGGRGVLRQFRVTLRTNDEDYFQYKVDLKNHDIKFFWKDSSDQPLKNFDNLNRWLNKHGKQLVFAMNGGMYQTDSSPLGLYIENGKVITPLNKRSGEGNFYVKPNGIFYITKDKKAFIETTDNFKYNSNIGYATQSGPLLLVNGKIHSSFKQNSVNVNIRNGVGVLPNGEVIFAMSKQPVNFYQFARFFKNAGCKEALYLDGFVSRIYLPSQNWVQTDGDFGVIIAEVSAK
jgi:Predicted periplasmic protein